MGHRNQNPDRQRNYRPSREGNAVPEYEEDGLHGDDRRQYRGRESYEQQTRGGQGGRSGMWPQRNVPRELDAPYRNNADEDRRGYQNLGSRSEFVSADRKRPDDANRATDDDYSRTDYGDPGDLYPRGGREDVCDRLSHDWDLDASEVEVTVSNARTPNSQEN